MIEKDKILKNPFYFISSYRKNFLNPNVKIITPNKHITILLQEKNIRKNQKTKTHNRLFIKRNNNNGTLIKKSSTTNIFPLLNNNKKSMDLNNVRYESEKHLENNSINNSYSKDKDKFLSFRLSKSKKFLNNNNDINKDINKKVKLTNIKFFKKKDDCKTSNNNSLSKNNNILFSSIKCDIDISAIRSKNFRKNEFNNDESSEKEKMNHNILRFRENRFQSVRKKKFKLKYCIYPGNNSKLIEQVMKYRNEVWERVPITHYKYCDLVWSPLTSSIDFKSSQYIHQCVNHIQFNEEISNKMRLYANLLRHCEKKRIDVYKIFPFTICLTLSHHTFEEQLENFKLLFNDINKYTPKSDVFFSSLFNALLNRRIGSSQTINIPKTFNSGKNMWIIKPVNLNRGRCIKVLNNLDSIIKEMKFIQVFRKIQINDEGNINIIKNTSKNNYLNTNSNISTEKENSSGVRCEFIMIQKYLEKPLLYQGRKFDIRIWVMFMTNRENEVYIFKEGHLKATSLKYNPDSDDIYVHLTNYSVQKHNINFSKIEIGNEIPFYEFQKELDRKKSGKNFKNDIYPKIVRIIRLTGGAAAKGKMNFMNAKNCFEIFGYDFILDENYRPYLLEINSNPGLEISSPLISQLLPRMIDDAFKLTIDEEFSLSSEFIEQESKFPVDFYNNNENLWEKYTIL